MKIPRKSPVSPLSARPLNRAPGGHSRVLRRTSLLRAAGFAFLLPVLVSAQKGTKVTKGTKKSPVSSATSSPTGRVPVIMIEPAGGSLVEQFKREADSAAAHGQIVLVDVGAKWCPPCREFESTLNDPIMIKALRSARLLHVDFDVWAKKLTDLSYIPTGYNLPEMFTVRRSGRFGIGFSHGKWEDYADSIHATKPVQYMAPTLELFLKQAADSLAKIKEDPES